MKQNDWQLAKIVTIGAYGFDETTFFQALQNAEVDTFCDIRQRRGMRGSRYAFANSKRLQANLERMGIRYLYFKALAPTTAVRTQQQKADKKQGIQKRKRTSLSDEFVRVYRDECLTDEKIESLLEMLGAEAQQVAVFCVERSPSACHRSLVAEWLAEKVSVEVVHVTS